MKAPNTNFKCMFVSFTTIASRKIPFVHITILGFISNTLSALFLSCFLDHDCQINCGLPLLPAHRHFPFPSFRYIFWFLQLYRDNQPPSASPCLQNLKVIYAETEQITSPRITFGCPHAPCASSTCSRQDQSSGSMF